MVLTSVMVSKECVAECCRVDGGGGLESGRRDGSGCRGGLGSGVQMGVGVGEV